MARKQTTANRSATMAFAVLAVITITSSARADRFTWTIDSASTVTTTLTATYGTLSASDTKTSGVAGTFGGTLALPAFDFGSILLDQADVGYTSNPTFNLSFGQFAGGATITTNALGFNIPGANGLSVVPTTPFPVSLAGSFTQTDTSVEGRGTMAYAGYGLAGAGIGSGTIALRDLSPIPGQIGGTLTQVGNQIRLTTPLTLDQSTTLENGVTVRAQVTGNVIANATTTAAGWVVDAGGAMNVAANWSSGSVPSYTSAIDTAVLGNVITAPRTLTSAPFVRRLVISSDVAYTIDTRMPLRSNANGVARLDVLTGTGHVINSLALLDNATLNVAAGASILAGFANGDDIVKTGGGTFLHGRGTMQRLHVVEGTIRFVSTPTLPANLVLNGTASNVLTVDDGALLDIADGVLTLRTDATALAARLDELRSELLDGYASGDWNGSGVVSSSIATNPRLAIGYLAKTQTNGSILIDARAVLGADSDMDGAVDFDDLLALAKSYGSSAYWAGGDFDYDATVGFNDLLLLAKNYNQSSPNAAAVESLGASLAADWALAQSIVPEPGVLGVALSGAILTIRRRRDRSRG